MEFAWFGDWGDEDAFGRFWEHAMDEDVMY